MWGCLVAVCCSRAADLAAFEKQRSGWFICGDAKHYLAPQPGNDLFSAISEYEQEWQRMLSAASILGVEDCMPNRLEQVGNVIACLCDSKSMATAENKHFCERSRDGKGVPRHLISYEDAMEALTVVDHESGPSPTQGSFAWFNSSPIKTPKPAANKGAQPARTPTAPQQPQQPSRSKAPYEPPQWAQGTCPGSGLRRG